MRAIEDLLQTALAAPAARRAAALRVLSGQAVAVEPGSQAPVYEPLLSQRETARRLGVSVPTFWRWRVPGYDLGGRRRYRLTEVETYLRSDAFRRRTAALRAERQSPRRISPLAKAVTGQADAKPTHPGRQHQP